MGTGGGGADVDQSPRSSNDWVELYFCSPYTPSWRGQGKILPLERKIDKEYICVSYTKLFVSEQLRRSSKISLWIWSIISGVVTVLGRPGRGASQVEKSPRLNWPNQFLTVAYDGACSPNITVRMVWISFGALPCGGGGIDSSRLGVAEIARVAWHVSFQPL